MEYVTDATHGPFFEQTQIFHKIIRIYTQFKNKLSMSMDDRHRNKEIRRSLKVIEISHLVKKYGDHVAVDDLSLTIESGKIYGFLGPNGAGKSTTMNMIAGYLGATAGEIKINGHDIFREPEEAKRCIGYLPEVPPLYMDMTVREYMEFASELKKIGKTDRKCYIEEAMQTTKISEVSERLIKNLSKGYRQRVGFAQAILGYPEVIILDEPTVGLDPKQIIEIRDLIRELGEKHTVILSSHILTEISAVCDHVFILSKGRLAASDSTENLLNLMSGAQELELMVKGAGEELVPLLEEFEEVDRVELVPEESSEELTALTVYAAGDSDIREMIFNRMAEHHLPILEMHTVSKSLEDVFLELTQEEGDQG